MPQPVVVLDAPGIGAVSIPQGNRAEFAKALDTALLEMRDYVIDDVKRRVATQAVLDPDGLIDLLDAASTSFMPRFGRMTTPEIIRAYAFASQNVAAGRVDPRIVNAMAEDYVQRIGGHFSTSSRDAVVSGFNAHMNKGLPPKVAFSRVIDGYGLTNRQMSGYTANTTLTVAVDSQQSRNPIGRAKRYIARSLRQRLGLLVEQEAHNISQEAQQVVWMWMQQNGRLSPDAVKVWVTTKDERVCKQCGPLHGKRVLVKDPFAPGIWTAGVHVNCRCEVTLILPTKASLGVVRKDLQGAELLQFNQRVKRDGGGRFASKPGGAALKERPRPSTLDDLFRETQTSVIPEKTHVDWSSMFRNSEKTSIGESAGFGTTSITGDTSLGTTSIGGTRIGGTTSLTRSGGVSTTGEKTEVIDRTGLGETRTALTQDRTQIVDAMTQSLSTLEYTPPTRRKRRHTVVLDKPLYVIISPWQTGNYAEDGMGVELHTEETGVYEDARHAMNDLDQDINAIIESNAEMANGGELRYRTSGGGEYVLGFGEMMIIGDAAACMFYDKDYRPEPLRVTMEHAKTGEMAEVSLDVEDAIAQIGYDVEDFPMLGRIVEGHDGTRGSTVRPEYSRQSYDKWQLSGMFTMHRTEMDGYPILDMDPDAEEFDD